MTERKRKKPRSPHYKANDEGGYANPPVKGQFKPDNKGGGRPKKEQSIEAAMRRMLGSKVPRGDGKPAIPMAEAFALATRKAMLTGGARGIELGLRMQAMFGVKPEKMINLACTEEGVRMLNDAELDLIFDLLGRAAYQSDPREEHLPGSLASKVLGPCLIVRRADGYLGLEPMEGSTWKPLPPALPAPDGNQEDE